MLYELKSVESFMKIDEPITAECEMETFGFVDHK